MGKGIILRVMEGTELRPELIEILERLLPNYKLDIYSRFPDYKRSYKRRIDSLYNAFLFIMDVYPLNPDLTLFTPQTIKNYVARCKDACNIDHNSVENLQQELYHFTAQLVDILACYWLRKKNGQVTYEIVQEAIACLNEAECYQLMTHHGRADIATLTTLSTPQGLEYIVQVDKSLAPHYDLLITELEQIKNSNYPKTPLWFIQAPAYQQVYYCNLFSISTITAFEGEKVVQDFTDFMKKWENIKADSLNLTSELEQIHSNSPPFAAWYEELSMPYKEMIKVLCSSPKTINNELITFRQKLLKQARQENFKKNSTLLATLPHWYWILSSRKQAFLAQVLKNAPSVKDAIASLCSRNRDLPGLSNFGAHILYTINDKLELTTHFKERYRSSHIAARDALHAPESVQIRHSDSNLAKILEKVEADQIFLIQTLISPLHGLDYVSGLTGYVPSLVSNYFPEPLPDLELYKLARSAVERSSFQNIWQHNHPYNLARLIYYTSATDKDSLERIEQAQKFIANNQDLQELLDSYKNTLSSPVGTATLWDYDGRELFLSSLEQLITLAAGGLSYGSCVSGKDRKALELLHTDTMILYKYIYGAWPKFGAPKEKEERRNFVNLFVSLYVSRHQQELAGQNAPGSEGIKTPDMYLPADISYAINECMDNTQGLKYEDRLATNNEVKNINKKLVSVVLESSDLPCKLIAFYLGEEVCTKLCTTLHSFIKQKELFYRNDTWSFSLYKEAKKFPKGIEQIYALLLENMPLKDNIDKLAKIFVVVSTRPHTGSSRTEATNSVYNRLRDVLTSTNLENSKALVNLALEEWAQLTKAAKKINYAVYS